MWVRYAARHPMLHSPPFMSVHFAQRVVMPEHEKRKLAAEIAMYEEDKTYDFELMKYAQYPELAEQMLERHLYYSEGGHLAPFWGWTHNEYHDVWIEWQGKMLKVHGNEYTILSYNGVVEYFYNPLHPERDPDTGEVVLNHYDEVNAHHLVANSAASSRMLAVVEETTLRNIQDACLVDGASPQTAMLMAMGLPYFEMLEKDDKESQPPIPNIGALVLHPLMALQFGDADHVIYDHVWGEAEVDEDGNKSLPYVGPFDPARGIEDTYKDIHSDKQALKEIDPDRHKTTWADFDFSY